MSQPRQHKRLAEDVLLTLFDRSACYPHETWDLESAFRAIGEQPSQTQIEHIGEIFVKRGFGSLQSRGPRLQGTQLKFSLSEIGKSEAVRILEERRPKSLAEKLHQMRWATWGGIAAILAALLAAAGLYISYLTYVETLNAQTH